MGERHTQTGEKLWSWQSGKPVLIFGKASLPGWAMLLEAPKVWELGSLLRGGGGGGCGGDGKGGGGLPCEN